MGWGYARFPSKYFWEINFFKYIQFFYEYQSKYNCLKKRRIYFLDICIKYVSIFYALKEINNTRCMQFIITNVNHMCNRVGRTWSKLVWPLGVLASMVSRKRKWLFLPDWIKPTWAKLDLENPMIPLKGQEMKILRFMHAAYQTIRLN